MARTRPSLDPVRVQRQFTAMTVVAERLSRTVAGIIRVDDQERFELFGSGIFVTHGGRYFVFSAAHVFDDVFEDGRTINVAVAGQNTMTSLSGRLFGLGDPVDLGFIELTAAQVERLTDVAFLTAADIAPQETPQERSAHLIVGYIARDNPAHHPLDRTQIKYTALAAKSSGPDRYRARQCDESLHLLLRMDRQRTQGPDGRRGMPLIKGMSGCGVWQLTSRGELLASILTEYHESGKDIVSTRAGLALIMLTRHLVEHPFMRSDEPS